MPLTRFVVDGLGVVTICLVAVLVLLGLFCVIYLFYFRNRIHSQGFLQLNYFSGPWIIRIVFISFSVWWGIGEIIRLNLLRYDGGTLDALSLKWKENVCKCYIVSNLGFSEPCLFLTLIFLLRAPLQQYGTLSPSWNMKTTSFVLLYCFPMLILQLVVVLVGPQYRVKHIPKLPSYFVNAAVSSNAKDSEVALCTYPLLSTIFLGLFATMLITYVLWLARQILYMIISKGLQKRVCTLIFSISSLFPLRVLLLGLSVLSKPERVVFNVIVFLAFLSFICCAGVGICTLVYLPIADSLALGSLQRDVEARGIADEYSDTISLIANQSLMEGSMVSSPGRNPSTSANCGSNFGHTRGRDDDSGVAFVELSLFNPNQH